MSLKPVLRHRYTENQPIALPTYCSFHSHHIKSSIVFSQLLRLKHICSNILDYEHQIKILTLSLLSRECPYKLISEQISRSSHITCTKSLTCSSIKKTHHLHYTLPSTNPYFLKEVNKDWLNICTRDRFNTKLSNPIMLANKQPLNLQQLLTRSKSTFLQRNQSCHKPQCKVCSHFDTKCSIKFDNNVTISDAKADCDSQNVVYILLCAKCPNAVYVGETSNRFRFRLYNHKHSIKHNLTGYPEAMHFNEQSHTMEDL